MLSPFSLALPVLSSGQAPAAPSSQGKCVLRRLVDAAQHEHAGEIAIIGAAGVTKSNVAELVRDTGLREVHASTGRVARQGRMQYRPADPIFMGGEKRNVPHDPANVGTIGTEFALKEVQEERVREYVDILRGVSLKSGVPPTAAVPPGATTETEAADAVAPMSKKQRRH